MEVELRNRPEHDTRKPLFRAGQINKVNLIVGGVQIQYDNVNMGIGWSALSRKDIEEIIRFLSLR